MVLYATKHHYSLASSQIGQPFALADQIAHEDALKDMPVFDADPFSRLGTQNVQHLAADGTRVFHRTLVHVELQHVRPVDGSQIDPKEAGWCTGNLKDVVHRLHGSQCRLQFLHELSCGLSELRRIRDGFVLQWILAHATFAGTAGRGQILLDPAASSADGLAMRCRRVVLHVRLRFVFPCRDCRISERDAVATDGDASRKRDRGQLPQYQSPPCDR
mmetsp:Transcript_17594/g.48840  ORF Transcript_17594/g.48840 Transcript_17594/m.48840 type:complete len:217 (-) Transcript_17594:310-960(-)